MSGAMGKITVKTHIIAAAILAAVQTAACFFANHFDIPIFFMLMTNIAYLAWISSGRKGCAPWISCFGFAAAQTVQLLLNKTGVVPSHSDIFDTDLGQFSTAQGCC